MSAVPDLTSAPIAASLRPHAHAPDATLEPAWVRILLTAVALGFVMLLASFLMLLAINLVQAWGRRRMVGGTR